MGNFFNATSDADRKLMADYDQAVNTFRTEVSRAMEDAGSKNPPLQKLLLTAAEALRLRPLSSEANNSKRDLRRLALSSTIVEKVFSTLHAMGETDNGAMTAFELAAHMKALGKTTTGRPEFRSLTMGAIMAVGDAKAEIAQDIAGKSFDQLLDDLRRMAAPATPQSPAMRKPPRSP